MPSQPSKKAAAAEGKAFGAAYWQSLFSRPSDVRKNQKNTPNTNTINSVDLPNDGGIRSMNIFFVTPEVDPIVKVGGLSDVAGALPRYLKKLGHDVRVICPAYGCIRDRSDWVGHPAPLEVWVGHEKRLCKVWESRLPGSDVPVYFIEYNLFFGRPEVYNSPWGAFQDNDHRYVFFTRAAINLCNYLNWYPDVFHCQDWTTGLLPVYLNTHDRGTRVAQAATVMTVHNLQFQGTFYSGLVEWAHLKRSEVFHADNLEAMGCVNMLKGGLYNATKITTVSPTYAEEIRQPGGGCGLEELMAFKGGDMFPILNGIDTKEWDPATEKILPGNFSAQNLSGKAACKAELQKMFGLKVDPKVPVFGFFSRHTHQKGIDLICEVVDRVMAQMQVQIVFLGKGQAEYQDMARQCAQRHPGRVATHIGDDLLRMKLLYSGSDCLLLPSRFEPCGLAQMYAMRYGTLPLVRATGGLKDTVSQYNEQTGEGTGFMFEEASHNALYYTIGWACSTWYDRPHHWQQLQKNAMKRAETFDWSTSAKQYEQLYMWAVEQRTGVKYMPVALATHEEAAVTVDEAVVEPVAKPQRAKPVRKKAAAKARSTPVSTPEDLPGLVAAVVPAV